MLNFLVALVEFSRRRAWVVLSLALVIVVGSVYLAATRLDVDTDTSKLLSPDLAWQKASHAFDVAFPHNTDQTVIVIDGTSPDAVNEGTAKLAAALEKRTDLFHNVQRPDSGPFFEKYGLLFLSNKELGDLSNQLASAQPLLGPLNADPTLHGLFGVLDQALGGFESGESKDGAKLATPFNALAAATRSVATGKPKDVDWGALMSGKPPRPEELRHFILVQPKLDYSAIEPGQAADNEIRTLVSQLNLKGMGLTVRLTGDIPLEDDEFSSVSEGAGLSTGLSLAAVIVLLFLGLRAPRLIVAIVITLVVGLLTTVGYAVLAVGTLNMISIAFAVLFIGIGVDFGIQFSMRYRAELHDVMTHDGTLDRKAAHAAALSAAARVICGPLGLAAVATCVGFFSFLPTDYRGVSELGLIAGTSMLIALIANLTVLPALLTLMPARGRPEAAGFAWARPIDAFLEARAKLVVTVAVLLAVGALATIPWLRFDADPLDIKDPTKESVITARDLMRDALASPYTIELLRPNLKSAEDLAKKLSDVAGVKQVLTVSSFVPEDQQDKLDTLQEAQLLMGPALVAPTQKPNIDAAAEQAALDKFTQHLTTFMAGPKKDQLGQAGQGFLDALKQFQAAKGDVAALRQALLGGFEGPIDQLRAGLAATPLSVDTLPMEIKRNWVTADGRVRVSVSPSGDMRDQGQMQAFVDAVRKVAPDATGAPVTILESGKTVARAFVTATVLAIVAITAVLFIALRRLRDVMLVLIPLVLAALYSLGSCVLVGIAFNYANVIAVPLLLGIGVAFDIYFVMAGRHATGRLALLESPTARAVVFSACTTGSALGCLMLSHHVGTASMGELLVLSLLWVLISTLFVQPALMALWKPKT